MIIYFTATGNSLDVAQVLASTTHDRLLDLGTQYKKGTFDVYVEQGETLGFVFPVMEWTTPKIVDEFIRKVRFISQNRRRYIPGYCYCVMTYGFSCGKTSTYLAKELKKYLGIHLDASYAIKDVNSDISSSTPPDQKKARMIQRQARGKAREISYMISVKHIGHTEKSGLVGNVGSMFTGHDEKHHSLDPFHVEATKCTHCNVCATVCPTNTIHMDNGMPHWTGDDCSGCLSCVNRCPEGAIQFGRATLGKPRYINPALAAIPVHDPWMPPEVPQNIDPRVSAAMMPDLRRPEDYQ